METEFSEVARNELAEIEKLVAENLKDTVSLVEKRDEEKIRKIFDREEEIDHKVRNVTENHLKRFYKRICKAEAGPFFLEIVLNLERISDHCENIAEYVEEMNE
jgi:phosphate:Na+ symporter